MKQVAIIIASLGLLLNAVHVHCCFSLPVCCDCPCLPPGPCPKKDDPNICPKAKYSLDAKGISYPNKNVTNVIINQRIMQSLFTDHYS